MERGSFIFYRSFYEALKHLDKETKADCYDAIMQYALDGIEPDVEGAVKTIFILIKPQIDANNRRYANGCKGGRPSENQNKTEEEPNENLKETKEEPNDNQSVTSQEPNENENENENVNENVNVNYQLIADMYNDTCVSYPKVTKLSDSRKKAIKARLKKYSPDDLKRAFELAEQSDFLKGNNNRNWSANFDWIIKDSNLAKVLDGNYKNKSPSKIEMDSKTRNFIEQNQVIEFGI